MVCHLYKIYGRILPQKLQGDFSFVLYDPLQVGNALSSLSKSGAHA